MDNQGFLVKVSFLFYLYLNYDFRIFFEVAIIYSLMNLIYENNINFNVSTFYFIIYCIINVIFSSLNFISNNIAKISKTNLITNYMFNMYIITNNLILYLYNNIFDIIYSSLIKIFINKNNIIKNTPKQLKTNKDIDSFLDSLSLT